MKKIIYILVGIPGSGKSTFAEHFRKNNPDVVVISRDKVREELGFIHQGEKKRLRFEDEETVSRICKAHLIEFLNSNLQYCIIDDMNLKHRYRKRIVELCNKIASDFEINFLVFNAYFELCCKRREKQISHEEMEKIRDSMVQIYDPELRTYKKLGVQANVMQLMLNV